MREVKRMSIANLTGPTALKINAIQVQVFDLIDNKLRNSFKDECTDSLDFVALRTVIIRSIYRANEEFNTGRGYQFEEIFDKKKGLGDDKA